MACKTETDVTKRDLFKRTGDIYCGRPQAVFDVLVDADGVALNEDPGDKDCACMRALQRGRGPPPKTSYGQSFLFQVLQEGSVFEQDVTWWYWLMMDGSEARVRGPQLLIIYCKLRNKGACKSQNRAKSQSLNCCRCSVSGITL